MSSNEISGKEAKGKAEALLGGAKTVYMGTNGSHGHPNVRAMMPVKVDGVKEIWFATDLESSKILELAKDSKAVIYVQAPRNAGECRLWGHVDILDDSESRKIVWRDELKKHFPDGANSARLRVLRFNVSNGVYCNKSGKIGEFKN
ncbi:MAG: pyridoxamine 5'-phosphate oxidase family protein [Synergistaceae bacterium]|nr:pyridoxamine 5'-phosphate oxidase family protein [Synergistaceae bacterium]